MVAVVIVADCGDCGGVDCGNCGDCGGVGVGGDYGGEGDGVEDEKGDEERGEDEDKKVTEEKDENIKVIEEDEDIKVIEEEDEDKKVNEEEYEKIKFFRNKFEAPFKYDSNFKKIKELKREIQRASTTDTFSHMLRASCNPIFKNLFIEQIIPMLTLTEQQMKKYLDTPQRGIDPALWELGKQKNPDPQKLIPVVKVGFQELQKQFKYQEEYGNKIHNSMKNIMDDIRQLSCMQTTIKVTIQNFKLKQTNIMRRVLKLVSAQEVERKKNLPLEEIEDQIRLRLENLYMQLQDLKGCLNELMAQSIKPGSFPRAQRYGLVVDKVQDISQYLKWQQDALQAIVNILKEDIQVVRVRVNIRVSRFCSSMEDTPTISSPLTCGQKQQERSDNNNTSVDEEPLPSMKGS
ncbi:nucleoporin p54-like [Procambarus clarkii]|uniref:nucleoporin p54-like n=1 Tax=Procambarus clarkii TaxID=6728 RepID=UPI0037446AE3